jgi:two-component system, chemotaxis family, protein-glutamate methylesterase/glutaminase
VSRKIKTLVVDDSTVVRRLLVDALSTDPSIEVVGIAANGKIALAKIPQLSPDVITLDMEMPEMDGLATLVELRKLYPKLPVIMFSTLTERGAEATLDALARGANDYVTKPANVGSVHAAIQSVQRELIPKIKQFCTWSCKADNGPSWVPTESEKTRVSPASVRSYSNPRPKRFDVLVIGTSTGGPNALAAVLPKLPASFPLPIVIVQHMPPIFTKHLADRLNHHSQLQVQEAFTGDHLTPGSAWVAPGNYHLKIHREGTQSIVRLNQDPQENSCRPAVDVLFRSAAEHYGGNVLALIMTGMGHDGKRGCDAIRQAGGYVIAQDEASSIVWGMPGSVVSAGLANTVLPLEAIAREVIDLANVGRPRVSTTGAIA